MNDRRLFEQAHAQDWIVIAAVRSDTRSGMTECIAALGGRRNESDKRRYLVPSDEYSPGRFGFVIDTARHRQF